MLLTRSHRQLRRFVTFLTASAVMLLAACTSTRGDDAELLTAGSPDTLCSLPYTQIGAIQGSGMASPMSGQSVTTQGVVVGDYEGPAPALRGFYLQDIRDDGDATTSDGIFVFNGDRDDVSIGDVVRVTGIAGEESEQTQIAAASIVACGTGNVQPTDVTLPFPSAMYLERYEGMLVRLPQTLYVTEHYQLGRFGEVVLSSGGRLPQPTDIAEPGAAAHAVQAANDLNRIIIDDASREQNPATILFARGGSPLAADNTLRGGDHVTGITGVLTQTSPAGAGGAGGAAGAAVTAGSSTYRVRPVNALDGGVPEFVAANPRPVAPPDVGGTLRVASFNLLNYFNTFADCAAGVGGATTACRGAENQVELERQRRKTVAAIVAMDPHILGVIEIENDGYGALSAIADLVGSLNAATASGRYAFIDADAATGRVNALGTDAIKVGLLYQPTRVSPAGRTAALNSTAFVNGGDAVLRNRPSLAQAFVQPDGRSVVVSINHFKSKGGACDSPDAGDGQAQCNAVRTVAARELIAWLATDTTRTGADVLILGDLNAYAREDPVTELARAGYTDLLAARVGTGPYSYVFNGQWGYLDYALASPGLVPQVTGVAAWHINADEPTVLDYNTNFRSTAPQTTLYRADPFRSSDHDPIIVGLELTGAAAPQTADIFIAHAGQPWSLPGRPPTKIEMAGVRKGAMVELRAPAQQGRVDTPNGAMTFEAVQEYVLTVRGDEISGSIHTYADSDTLEIPSRSIHGRRPADSDRGRGRGPMTPDPGPDPGAIRGNSDKRAGVGRVAPWKRKRTRCGGRHGQRQQESSRRRVLGDVVSALYLAAIPASNRR